jgi:hypothetical protein
MEKIILLLLLGKVGDKARRRRRMERKISLI